MDKLKGAAELKTPLPLIDLTPKKFSSKKKKTRKVTNAVVAEKKDGTMFTDSLEAANVKVGGNGVTNGIVARQVTVVQQNNTRLFNTVPGKSLLNAAKDSQVELPHSCVMGGCGACKVKLISGEVVLTTPHCLDSAMTDVKIEVSDTI